MKVRFPAEIEKYRITTGPFASNRDYGFNGWFLIPYRNFTFKVIISDGGGWDHVSISLKKRCPNWPEMCHFKDLFFDPEETVIQFHPPKSQYVNAHPFCLHLWRKHGVKIELPPRIMLV